VLALTARESTRYIRGDGRDSSAGVLERDQIVLAARHEQVRRWLPLDILDVPSIDSKYPLLSTLKDQTREVESALIGESFVVRREAVHVRLLDVQTMQ
jgi:hypothetical protein